VRYAILSDIHGNLDALEAVLSSARERDIEHVVCLGDIVGYGPQPGECLRLIKNHNCTVVAGNHDFAVAERIDSSNFNVYAREATLWTREQLSSDEIEFLSELPLVAELDGFTAVHGTLHTPELFDYIQTSYDAHLSMQEMRQPLCVIGHSHVPIAFVQDEAISYHLEPMVTISAHSKTIVNVGSVGQPRDCDPRSSFAIYDSDRHQIERIRVPYDIDAVISKIRGAGLPRPLGERLRSGR
jgi:diadenosine tetraphosphatase ApaH/serine/threonine PP2A family protein phosphatase